MYRNVAVVSVLFVLAMFFSTSTAAAITLTVADYQDDFQGVTPAAGWKYQTNGNGVIGTEANYTDMVWNNNTPQYTVVADSYPVAGLGNFAALNSSGGHPGPATTNEGGFPWDNYVIANYKVQSSDMMGYNSPAAFQLTSGTLSAGGGSISLQVFVNDLQIGATDIVSPSTTLNFARALGNLGVGDDIYVIVGPNGDHSNDGFTNFDFTIQFDAEALPPAPEPSTALMLGAGMLGLSIMRRRR